MHQTMSSLSFVRIMARMEEVSRTFWRRALEEEDRQQEHNACQNGRGTVNAIASIQCQECHSIFSGEGVVDSRIQSWRIELIDLEAFDRDIEIRQRRRCHCIPSV